MSLGQVSVITGPSGAGKTTVARLLADTPTATVHLHAADLWTWIRPKISPQASSAGHIDAVVIGVVVETAFGFARGGFPVLVDGIVDLAAANQFLFAARAYDITLRYVALRPTLETVTQRAASRTEKLATVEDIVASYDTFSDLGPLERHVIDSTGLSASVTAALVRRALSAPHTTLWPLRTESNLSAPSLLQA